MMVLCLFLSHHVSGDTERMLDLFWRVCGRTQRYKEVYDGQRLL